MLSSVLKSHLEGILRDLLETIQGYKLLLMDKAIHQLLDYAFPLSFFRSLMVTRAILI